MNYWFLNTQTQTDLCNLNTLCSMHWTYFVNYSFLQRKSIEILADNGQIYVGQECRKVLELETGPHQFLADTLALFQSWGTFIALLLDLVDRVFRSLIFDIWSFNRDFFEKFQTRSFNRDSMLSCSKSQIFLKKRLDCTVRFSKLRYFHCSTLQFLQIWYQFVEY